MTKRAMTGADRTKIIEALNKNPNAAAAARQFGFGETEPDSEICTGR